MRVVAAPRPDAPPVTTKVLSFRSIYLPQTKMQKQVLRFARDDAQYAQDDTGAGHDDTVRLAGVALTMDSAVAITPATSATFAGRISVFVVRARLPNCAIYSSATRKFTACKPPSAVI